MATYPRGPLPRSERPRLGVTSFALALLPAGAEPEELATVITASACDVDGVAFGDVIGANAAMLTIALGVGALISPPSAACSLDSWPQH